MSGIVVVVLVAPAFLAALVPFFVSRERPRVDVLCYSDHEDREGFGHVIRVGMDHILEHLSNNPSFLSWPEQLLSGVPRQSLTPCVVLFNTKRNAHT